MSAVTLVVVFVVTMVALVALGRLIDRRRRLRELRRLLDAYSAGFTEFRMAIVGMAVVFEEVALVFREFQDAAVEAFGEESDA